MAKLTQIMRVERLLKQQGFVSRNALIDQPFDKVLRLGALIFKLRQKGLDITTEDNGVDCIYRIRPKGIKTLYVEGGEIIKIPVW